MMTVLQWGHDFSVMEIDLSESSVHRLPICFNGAMTFQSWKLIEYSSRSSSFESFNGAMTFQSWKCDTVEFLTDLITASMGP